MEKLKRDLEVLDEMAAVMDDYLRSDVLFYPTSRSDLPKATIGGYLMRQHRLLELRDMLGQEQLARLHQAIHQFNEALNEKIVRFEQKANRELEARVRQWREYLNEVKRGANIAYYESAVDTRVMIELLIAQLRIDPYQIDEDIPPKVALLDRELSRYWERGEFVWPPAWKPAYSREKYWWLYGHPKER